MNPRYRRLLIPGLLTILIVIVLIASLVRSARGATLAVSGDSGTVVSRLGDPRIGESSGLVLSLAHPGIAYTINDSGNAPIVYAVEISTGRTVGTTRVLGGTLQDTEALSIDRAGTLWIADTGDNLGSRDEVALYAFSEPGPGSHTVTARRYRLAYADGPHNVEALLISPKTGEKFLITKGLLRGTLFPLPSHLSRDSITTLRPAATALPGMVTDGAITPDGRLAAVRTYQSLSLYEIGTWRLLRTSALPAQKQGETLAMEPGGKSALIGSEGADSPLLRIALDTSRPVAKHTHVVRQGAQDSSGGHMWWYVGTAVVIAGASGAIVALRRR